MSITIKQAFEKLAMVTGAAVKNPWFVGRNLNQAFADIADNIEGGGGGSSVEVDAILTEGTKIATITVDGDDTDLYAPAGGGGGGDWTYVNTVTGQTPVSLPSGWKELLVYVEAPGTSSGVLFPIPVLKDVLAKAAYSNSFISGGSAGASSDHYASIEVSESAVKLVYVFYQTSARTSDAKMIVYYK